MYQMLHIIAGKPLIPRFKFKAIDGSERCIFEVEHTNWQIHGNAERNFVNPNFINSRCIRAANIIIGKYHDQINTDHEASYFIQTSYQYRGKDWGIGIPMFWKSPLGDNFISQFTKNNCGKLTTFIAEERLVKSSPKHPNDIPIKMAALTGNSYAAIIYV